MVESAGRELRLGARDVAIGAAVAGAIVHAVLIERHTSEPLLAASFGAAAAAGVAVALALAATTYRLVPILAIALFAGLLVAYPAVHVLTNEHVDALDLATKAVEAVGLIGALLTRAEDDAPLAPLDVLAGVRWASARQGRREPPYRGDTGATEDAASRRPARPGGTAPHCERGSLLDRNGLREVARLVDVEAAQPRDPVGEQLEGQRGEDRLEERRRLRHVDDVVGVVLDVLVPVRRDRDHVRAAGPRLLDVGDDLVVDVDVRRHDDDRRLLIEECDRPVLHLTGRVRLRRDVGDLLELERALERDRQADVPPEVEEERRVVVAARDLLDRVVGLEEVLDLARELVDEVEDELELARGQRLPDLRELQRDEVEERDLRGERLRGGDAHLQAGTGVEHRVHLARHLGAHHVRDCDGARPLLPRKLERLDRVARLSLLRDADDEVALVDHGVAIEPLAGDVELDGDPPPLLDDVAADDARVVRGAAGEEDDPAQVLELLVGHAEALEDELPVADAVADRLGDGIGLLVDLLEHERLVAPLGGALVVP